MKQLAFNAEQCMLMGQRLLEKFNSDTRNKSKIIKPKVRLCALFIGLQKNWSIAHACVILYFVSCKNSLLQTCAVVNSNPIQKHMQISTFE